MNCSTPKWDNIRLWETIGTIDPNKQDLYFKFSVFLPYINNELKSTNSSEFKDALTRLDKMVLIGGPNDGVITPWESRFKIINFYMKFLSRHLFN